MDFVNSWGVLCIIAGVMLAVGYAIRHRGNLGKWLENINHEENKGEKTTQILRLRREKEDIDRNLAELEEN